MDTREWALLIFTILGQIAAGSLLVLMIVRTYAVRTAGVEQADRFTDGPLYIIVPIMGLALLSSLFHLGSPLNIAKAVPNLGTSWLSREVVIAVIFVIIAGAVYSYAVAKVWRRCIADSYWLDCSFGGRGSGLRHGNGVYDTHTTRLEHCGHAD